MVYIYVGIAGALGAILRYLIGISLLTNSTFPWATLVTNLAGSFLLAWLTTTLFKKIPVSPVVASSIGTGFVGSFTTFSTLSVETVELFKDDHLLLGIAYVLVSIAGGIFMSRLGFKVNKEVEKA
ncbi:fluoride efflux transporter FluC [Pseudalkalibacillus caeni]|uniref:Fluoride-specific ion channel FluC n=1 Tax=Exobacillus caeni TaxID=2574798 RepID=A0A5R9F631_9BACL|nr:CrcB family protein [Pseudalkalibacillus caeni]TLS37088.1 fluoride efflux transporter CrcB [Pseudalkalibacillus caeni]